jgi:lipooligosaccharide transport system permease protein
VLWATLRVAMTTVAFLVVMVAFGAARSWWVVLALPAGILTGAAHTAPLAGITARLDNDYSIANIMRFGIVPLFLFSGTFFPVEQLPDWIEPLAYATPLWHGVALCRSLSLGDATALGALGHVAYMAAFVAAGAVLAVRSFERRLVT